MGFPYSSYAQHWFRTSKAALVSCTIRALVRAILGVVGACSLILGQETQGQRGFPFRFGITGGYGVNRHVANFAEFAGYPVFVPRTPSIPGPENFRDGAGRGMYCGVLYEAPLFSRVSLAMRLFYAEYHGLFTTSEPALLGDRQGNVVEALHQYHISTSIPSIGVGTGVKWYPVGSVYIAGSLHAAWLYNPSFSQEERLVESPTSPSTILGGFTPDTFSKVRNQQRGIVPNIAPVQLFGELSCGYEIPIGIMRLVPECGFVYGLTNVFNNTEQWHVRQIRAGISAILTLQTLADGVVQLSDEMFDEIESNRMRRVAPEESLANDSVIVREQGEHTDDDGALVLKKRERRMIPMLDVEAWGAVRVGHRFLETQRLKDTAGSTAIEEKGWEERRERRVLIPKQELVVRYNYSLLPYVFFDAERSTTLPQRYVRLTPEEAENFSTDRLRSISSLNSREHPYYHVLNIVGQRMRRIPQAKLNILGCVDGASTERDNLKIARQRALAVASYLRTVWGIDSARLVIGEARLLTKARRSINEQDRQAENRRVELSSDTTALLEPIQVADTVYRTFPYSCRVVPRVNSAFRGAVREWRITLEQDGHILKEWHSDSALPDTLQWVVQNTDSVGLVLSKSLRVRLAVRFDGSEEWVHSPVRSLPIEEHVFRATDDEYCANILMEKFNLILFDATKSSMTQSQALTLKSLNTRITSRSKVLVEGFMDKLPDDDESNRRLSRARAQSVAQSLKALARGAQIEVYGYGSQRSIYDERLPEGRMYSRTVLITIETPLTSDGMHKY
ncbi:MAG: OmpA family protein [Bacteroidota bacterium]|nr:OmpA family protein [Candidatus Kapabacteria bacterium]MDW8221129.1 OmpA family protein [Bacteroidota bacterium]